MLKKTTFDKRSAFSSEKCHKIFHRRIRNMKASYSGKKEKGVKSRKIANHVISRNLFAEQCTSQQKGQ